jgi:hypothetical protein
MNRSCLVSPHSSNFFLALTTDEMDQDLAALKKKKKRKPKKKKQQDEGITESTDDLPRIPDVHFLKQYSQEPAKEGSALMIPRGTPLMHYPDGFLDLKPAPPVLDKTDFLPESLRNPQPAMGKKKSSQSMNQLSKKQQQKAARKISVAEKKSATPLPTPVILESTPQTSTSIVAYSESQSSSQSDDEYQDAETSLVMDDLPIPPRPQSPNDMQHTPQPSLIEEVKEVTIPTPLTPLPIMETIVIPNINPSSNMIYFGQVGVSLLPAPSNPCIFKPASSSNVIDDEQVEFDLEEEITDMFDERKLLQCILTIVGWLSALAEDDVQILGFRSI